ncbi:LOW QUALITY PROTEIN: hypothetical protein T265_13787 [Opisthorchis viverrini]|uniref:Uncharacterized protein n=1 Tax=Opisthorchis viverrini TaxID=6198 RepID=A0A074ZNT0_OPIVI|nr:LOW QUALITY PROTEIN: hypothetical protein T265_13787 [Opisthorchis viverrini]KER27452.1 LOW QUALITY PROTEIN: hypothetical protein T265_13787 [Opisthorchis viverrini]
MELLNQIRPSTRAACNRLEHVIQPIVLRRSSRRVWVLLVLYAFLDGVPVTPSVLGWSRFKKWRLIDVSGIRAVSFFPDCLIERAFNITRRTLWLYGSEASVPTLMLLSLMMMTIALLIRLLKIRRQSTTGFALFGAHQAQSPGFRQPYLLLETKLHEINEIHSFANSIGFSRDSPGTQLNPSFVMFPAGFQAHQIDAAAEFPSPLYSSEPKLQEFIEIHSFFGRITWDRAGSLVCMMLIMYQQKYEDVWDSTFSCLKTS